MQINNQNEINTSSRTIKKEWKEPQLAQLNVKDTKSGTYTATYEDNLHTKHGGGIDQS